MFQTVIAVFIGLSFLYFILAVLCSGIKEFYAGIFNLRAATLEDAISRMLDSVEKEGASQYAKDFYDHPLIRDLAKDGKKPSYIPAQYFSGALEAILRARSIGSADFPALIKDLPDGDLKKKLSMLATQAGNDVAGLRTQVETWFNNTMDRVSGWYKRKAQVIMFCASIILVIAVNADTVAVARTLWQNPAVRDSVVDDALEAQKSMNPAPAPGAGSSTGSATSASPSTGTSAAGPGTPTTSGTGSSPSSSTSSGANSADAQRQLVQSAQTQLKTLADINQFPIGWSKAEVPQGWEQWGLRLAGWLLSAFAATLGAPFWFDAMSKLINLRTSGAPPQRAPAAATAPATTVVVQTEAVKAKAAGAGA